MKLPVSPELGQIYEVSNSKKLKFDGEGWIKVRETDITPTPTDKYSVTISSLEINEVPAGEVDGINSVFNLSKSPIAASEQIYLNGLLSKPGKDHDYTIVNSTIYFNDAPLANTRILCSYSYLTGTEIVNEIPTMDPIDKSVIILKHVPQSSTIRLYLNGLLQKQDEDFVIVSNTLVFIEDLRETDKIIVNYFSII